VKVPDSDSLDMTNEISVFLWVNIKSRVADYDDLIAKRTAPSPYAGFSLYLYSEDKIGLWLGYNTDRYIIGSDKSLEFNKWVHLGFTVSADRTVKIWKNGVAIYTDTMPGDYYGIDDNSLRIPQTAGEINGTIDEVRIYNRALSAEEIRQLYETKVTYPTETSFSFSESNKGDDDVVYKLYRNGAEVSNPDTVTLGVGYYYYTVNTTGGANWTERSLLIPLRVEKGDPTANMGIAFNGRDQNMTFLYPSLITVSGVETNPGDSDVTYTLYENGEALDGLTKTVYATSEFSKIYTLNTTGGANWTGGEVVRKLEVIRGSPPKYLKGENYYNDAKVKILRVYSDGDSVSVLVANLDDKEHEVEARVFSTDGSACALSLISISPGEIKDILGTCSRISTCNDFAQAVVYDTDGNVIASTSSLSDVIVSGQQCGSTRIEKVTALIDSLGAENDVKFKVEVPYNVTINSNDLIDYRYYNESLIRIEKINRTGSSAYVTLNNTADFDVAIANILISNKTGHVCQLGTTTVPAGETKTISATCPYPTCDGFDFIALTAYNSTYMDEPSLILSTDKNLLVVDGEYCVDSYTFDATDACCFGSYCNSTISNDETYIDVGDGTTHYGRIICNTTSGGETWTWTNFTFTNNSYVQNATVESNLSVQYILKNDTIRVNVMNYTYPSGHETTGILYYEITRPEPSGFTLDFGDKFEGELNNLTREAVLLTGYHGDWLNETLSDWVQDPELTTQANGTAYIMRNITVENEIDVDFENISYAYSCREGWSAVKDSGLFNISSLETKTIYRALQCSKDNVIWFNQTDSLTPYSTYVRVRTPYHQENVTAYYRICVNNTDTIDYKNVFVDTNETIAEGWFNTTPYDPYIDVNADSVVCSLINWTIEGAYEHSYTDVYQSGYDANNVKNTYTAWIVVNDDKVVPNLPINYSIPLSRLENWNERTDAMPVTIKVNGSSKDITWYEDGSYLHVQIGTSHGSSSLEKGTYELTVEYTSPAPAGAGGPAGGGGGAPRIERLVSFDISPKEIDIKSIPYDTEKYYIEVSNDEDERVRFSIEIVGDYPEYGLVNATSFWLDPKQTAIVELVARMPEKINVTRSFIVRVGATKNTIRYYKEILVRVTAIEGKAVGEPCDRDEECLSGNCVFETGYIFQLTRQIGVMPGFKRGRCAPREYVPPEVTVGLLEKLEEAAEEVGMTPEQFILGMVVTIGGIGLAVYYAYKRKWHLKLLEKLY